MTPAERIECRLCGGAAALLFPVTVLGRHATAIYRCAGCALCQTGAPHWLDEAYRDPLIAMDTGVLARCLAQRRLVATFLHLSGVRGEPCLDWGGGYGVLTRLMRDAGFEYLWADPHAPNLFARGFEWTPARGAPRACTAFEVLEHLAHPLDAFREIAALGAEFVITSTRLYPAGGPTPDWDYLALPGGQHVAFYAAATLERLGRETGYPHVSAGPAWQLFARRPVPAWRWDVATRLARVAFEWVRRRRPSFTETDSARLAAGAPPA